MYNGDKKYLWITVAAGGKDWSTPSACEAGRRVCHAYLIIIVVIMIIIIVLSVIVVGIMIIMIIIICQGYLIIIVICF